MPDGVELGAVCDKVVHVDGTVFAAGGGCLGINDCVKGWVAQSVGEDPEEYKPGIVVYACTMFD